MAITDFEAELLRLRQRIAALMDEAGHNSKLLHKTQQRELELLKADELPELFEVIGKRLVLSYNLQRVTLVLCDPDHEIRHLLLATQVHLQNYPQVIFVDELAELASWFQAHQRPWLGPYSPRHQRLFPGAAAIKSVALIPLWQQQQLHACLCFGSDDERRFSRELGTDFLAHLGVIASFALENAINRARLVLSGVTDFLTGWHNRRYLNERLKEELARARRVQTSIACIVLDLDHFKAINDTHGHLAGDLALREAAERIKHQARDSDTTARFGGDEFVVLAPAIAEAQATSLAERMRLAVCATPLLLADGSQYPFTISVGVALLQIKPTNTLDLLTLAEQLLREADAALYRAKQRGRNCVELTVCS
jgi:diguanylate cyclase (GGDEF)-like protein